MQVIDIEAMRSPRRETPQISFRRTESDRRPARVVRRPNDGPGDWKLRQQLAEERLAQASRRSIAMPEKPVSTADFAFAQRKERTALLLGRLAAAPLGLTVRDLSENLSVGEDMTGKIVTSLAKDGFVHRVFHSRPGGGRYVTVQITEAGLARLSGASQ